MNPFPQHWVEDGAYSSTTNRLTSGLTYDPAGNVTRDERFRQRQLSYDANNRQRLSAGADTCQSAEWLEGLRAGGGVTKRLFTKQLKERGLDALMSRLYADDPDFDPPESHSDVWKKAFRGAINSVRERIRSANEEGGLDEVEDALKEPFDAAENP